MFSTRRYWNLFLSLGFVFALGCDGGLGGCGCGEEPLPSWDYVPVDQQVEGGGQVRVTPNGFNKLTALIPPIINDAVSGLCLDRGSTGYTLGTGADWCDTNQGTCTDGCAININLESIDMTVPSNDRLNTRVQISAGLSIPVDYRIIGIGGSCTIDAAVESAVFDVDLNFGIDPVDGELTLGLSEIQQLTLNPSIDGCGLIGDIVDTVLGIIDDFLNSFIFDLLKPILTPLLNDLIQGLLPDPLGLNNKIDGGALVSGISPGTNATIEFRGVPGGYVELKGGGMSLGLITGVNADEDEATRTPDLDSEPALCVPPLPAIDFAAAPHNLPVHPSRGTHSLAVAGEFNGTPDPAAELAIGLSETTLDLFGHHAVTSGLMCLGIGTSLVEQLNLGLIGILVPSLAELGSEDGSDPLLLVLRPQKALDFRIGEGTEEDPSLTITIDNLELDFYAFLFERYTRGFTISISMEVGVNLEFTTDMNGQPAIMPILTGLETDAIELTVLNNEFLREDSATLEQVLPSIFDLAIPLITDGLGAISLPDFAGFSLTNLSVNKVTTSEDEFLAIFANLGQVTSPMMLELAARFPSLGAQLAEWEAQQGPMPARVTTQASLQDLYAPRADLTRAFLAGKPEGELPAITLAVPERDDAGRPLEYSWSIRRGIARKFRAPVDGQLVIRDRAFAIQGEHEITVTSRVVGDYRTHDTDGVEIAVVIDSVGPRVFTDRISTESGRLVVPAHDLISPVHTLTYAFSGADDLAPTTAFLAAPITQEQAVAMAGPSKMLKVWVRDERGNMTGATFDPTINFHGAAGEGCDCSHGGMDDASAGGLAVIAGLTFLMLVMSRRRRLAVRAAARRAVRWMPYVGAVVLMSVVPACSCGSDPGGDLTCEIDEDCAALCPDDTIPICFDNQCVCAEDVPYGRMGQHSDLAVSSGGAAWVSGYNSSHGDLVVARWPEAGPIPNPEWQFVDGVPDGPVVLETSEIRGGIFEAGPDVGTFTSIAVQPGDAVAVTYFDVDNASLKYTHNTGGVWTSHTIESGNIGGDPELGFTTVGKYSSLTVRSDDGRPGVAYLAEVYDGAGNVTTELRYAASQTATPASAADWNVWVVDSVTVPAPTSEAPDILGIPLGVGLYVDSARRSDETPVLVYYDRISGDLKAALFDGVAGTFQTPIVLDSGDRDSVNTDVGWYPSVTIDDNDDLHVTYVSATNDDLYYVNTVDNLPEIVDDGYRIVGQTEDGLPKPEFHFVGDDSSVTLTGIGPVIAYQDATSHEILLASRNADGNWERESVAGSEDPFVGGYGFYTNSAMTGDNLVMSTWVVDQPANAVWVEIFRRQIVIE